MGRLAFAALLFALTTSSVMAGQATVGDASVTLPAPAGFCELVDNNPSDKRMITNVGQALANAGNQLLTMSADCQQLSDWRIGKRRLLDDYAQYQTSSSPAATETPSQTCATLRTQGEQINESNKPRVKEAIEKVFDRVKLNESAFLGVLGEDPDACYAAVMTKIKTEAGPVKTQVSVFAVTVIKGNSVFAYRFAVYVDSSTVDAVLAKLKPTVAALLAANRT
jgi:hypothetical protein